MFDSSLPFLRNRCHFVLRLNARPKPYCGVHYFENESNTFLNCAFQSISNHSLTHKFPSFSHTDVQVHVNTCCLVKSDFFEDLGSCGGLFKLCPIFLRHRRHVPVSGEGTGPHSCSASKECIIKTVPAIPKNLSQLRENHPTIFKTVWFEKPTGEPPHRSHHATVRPGPRRGVRQPKAANPVGRLLWARAQWDRCSVAWRRWAAMQRTFWICEIIFHFVLFFLRPDCLLPSHRN